MEVEGEEKKSEDNELEMKSNFKKPKSTTKKSTPKEKKVTIEKKEEINDSDSEEDCRRFYRQLEKEALQTFRNNLKLQLAPKPIQKQSKKEESSDEEMIPESYQTLKRTSTMRPPVRSGLQSSSDPISNIRFV